MSTNFKENPIQLIGRFLAPGMKAPEFQLTRSDLSEFTRSDVYGKTLLLNIFPSLDTEVCATSVRKFNQMTAGFRNVITLCISCDLPFAQKRFCTVNGIENVIPLSCFRRGNTFGEDYGVMIADGPMRGLLARAVVIISPEGKIAYSQLVPEITVEPNYTAILDFLKESKTKE